MSGNFTFLVFLEILAFDKNHMILGAYKTPQLGMENA
jgi:hypothetical protein